MFGLRYSFVIPAYNEAKRLTATLDAIKLFAMSHLENCEIIVVDDGSTDGTAEVARAYRAAHCLMSVHRFPHRGKGFAIRQGVRAAQGDIILLCDADLRESMNEALYLIKALASGVDIAIGSRWLNPVDLPSTQPLFRRVSSRVFNLVAGHILALPFKDTQCGLKALTRESANRVFPLLSLNGWGYDLELIHVAVTQRLKVVEIDVHFLHDYRDSHFRPINDGLTAFLELVKIRCNHLRGLYGSEVADDTFTRFLQNWAPNAFRSAEVCAEQRTKREIAERRLEVQLGTGLRVPSNTGDLAGAASRPDVAA